jgi:small subunit ribosomal protein S6
VREYEVTLIIQPEISDEGVGALQERLDGILEGFGTIRLLYDDLGKRRLAYEIQNYQKGRYLMLRFLDDGSNIKGLERAFGLEDSIIRFLTVQVDDAVEDVAARQAEAAEERRIRAEKAAERAAREAEEAARQQVEAAEADKRAAAESAAAAKSKAAAEPEAAAKPETAAKSEAAAKPKVTADEEPEKTAKNAEPSALVAAPDEGEAAEAGAAEEVVR